MMVAAGLRRLGGEQHKSLTDIFHFPQSSAKRVVGRIINAVIVNLNNIISPTNPKNSSLSQLLGSPRAPQMDASIALFLQWMASPYTAS
jgi:hypothetical protein